MLSKEEINRYSRHIILPEIGMKGQEKLKRAKVLVIGAGGLGCPVLQYLVSAGVGTIGIADDETVDETNLQRQILFFSEDVGKSKSEAAKQKLSLLNPNCRLPTVNCRLSPSNALDIIKEYDLVIDGSDNFPTRYLVNDACVISNKPLVFGSIFKFEGQVSVFNYKSGPTYRCLFPQPPQGSPNCSEIGVLGVLSGIIGTMMANEALKIILGIGETLSGKLLVFDALTTKTQLISFEKPPGNSKINSLIDYENFCVSPCLTPTLSPMVHKDSRKSPADSFGEYEVRNSVRTEGEGEIPAERGVKEISADELKKLIEQKEKIQIIDVREPSEYSEHNIGGINIPIKILPKHTDKIRKDIPVIIHCQRGGRSKQTIEILQKDFGFTNLANLTGGIESFGLLKKPQKF